MLGMGAILGCLAGGGALGGPGRFKRCVGVERACLHAWMMAWASWVLFAPTKDMVPNRR